jgi:hypothetical protein
MPAPAPGWQLRLALGRATLRAPDNTVVYQGTCRLPAGWRAVAALAGGPVLIIGAIGLLCASEAGLTPQRLHALIHAAARSGRPLATHHLSCPAQPCASYDTRQPPSAHPGHHSLP